MAAVRVLVVPSAARALDQCRAVAAALGPDAVLGRSVAASAVELEPGQVQCCIVVGTDLPQHLHAVRELRRLPHELPVLACTAETESDSVLALLRAGADGVVPFDATPELLRRCVTAAVAGEAVLPRAGVRVLVRELHGLWLRERSDGERDAVTGLTAREREVAALLYAGLSTEQVAARLFVSRETVRSHVHGAMRKLRLRSREELFRRLDEVTG